MISLYAADSQSCPFFLLQFHANVAWLRCCRLRGLFSKWRRSRRCIRQTCQTGTVCGDPDSFRIVSCVDGRAIILGLQPPTARGNRLQQQRHYQPNLIQLGLI